MPPFPTLTPAEVASRLDALAADPALTFQPGGLELWYLRHGDRRLRLRATVRALSGVQRFRSQAARAWLRSLGVAFEHEHRHEAGDTEYGRLPDLAYDDITARWDADLARGEQSELRSGPQDWRWGVRWRDEVLPLKRAAGLAAGVDPTTVQTHTFHPWLARRGFEIVPPMVDEPRWWIFQGDPMVYDIAAAVRELDRLPWRTPQHRREIRPQDRVVIWQTGQEAAALALATVLCQPLNFLHADDEEPYWRDAKRPATDPSDLEVWLRVDEVFDPPVRRDTLREDPRFADLRVVHGGVRGTNVPLGTAQAHALLELAGLTPPTAATSPAATALTDVDARTHDILKVLTRIPVARGQVEFFHLLRSHPEGVRAKDVQRLVFEHDPSTPSDPRQGAGLLAALAKRINGTDLSTGQRQGIHLLARQHGDRWTARPELWQAIDRLPPLREALAVSWEEARKDPRYIACTMPEGLAVARAASPEVPESSPWERLRREVAHAQLVYADETLASFLLALQAKRFVILCGISGTGKTRLAQVVAAFASQPSEVDGPAVPTASLDAATVEVAFQPYMAQYRRIVLPAALLHHARLPMSEAGWSSEEVEVTWPGGTTTLKLGSDVSRPSVRQLLLKGPVAAWLAETFEPGDRLLLGVRPREEEGWDGLTLGRPESGAPRRRTRRTHEILPVRPDWKDTRALLGFYNPITEAYARTPFLDLVLDAGEELQAAEREGREPVPYFAILDEMNLAHVEHYFADVLSGMESGEALPLHADDRVAEGTAEGSRPVPKRLTLPRNLFVVGTVNLDETTHMFSPKVLDRAFVMELTDVWLTGAPPPGRLALPRLPEPLAMLGAVDASAWKALDRTAGPDARALLLAVHRTLSHAARPAGYRPVYEMARFLQLAFEQGADTESTAAADQAVLQKMLPKLGGRQHELEPVLRHLFDVTVDGQSSTDPEPRQDPDAWVLTPGGALVPLEDAGGDEGQGSPVLARCAAKLHRMIRDVRRQGFTSFIG